MAETSFSFKIYAFSAIVFLAAVTVAGASVRVAESFPVPRLSVNLDDAPEKRWIPALRHWNLTMLREDFQNGLDTIIPVEALPLVEKIGEVLDDLLPAPYAGEIRGIANTIGLGVGDMAVLNMLYDFTAACTSIVAQDTNGTIWHARNLDYELTDNLRNVTAIIDYKSQGKIVYTSTSFVGQVGIFTGMKPNKFTISLNERDKGSSFENIFEMLQAFLTKQVELTTFAVRDALTLDKSFDEVIQRFTSEQVDAPAYLIVAGIKPGEGAVITRNRLSPLDVWKLDLSGDRWYLLETNYDHWVPPPKDDDRRDPGNKAMRAVGQKNINNNTLWNVLSVQPVLNNSTVYTALMCAAKPEIYSTRTRELASH